MWMACGLRRNRSNNESGDVEYGLIPLSSQHYTFCYEASCQKSGQVESNPSTNTVESPLQFGNAFQFTPETVFADDITSNQRKKKLMLKSLNQTESIVSSDDDIPAHYQSIFTYESALHIESKYPTDLDEEFHSSINGRFYNVLVVLSSLLLLLTFPITALFCFKRLSKTQRVITFRLGRKQKLRGPGCILVLPFVDECHVVDLAEQTLKVKPISAPTADAGEVEIGCLVLFHIVEAESAVTYGARDPYNLVLKRSQLAISTAVSRIQWDDIISGHALPDISIEIRASVNSYCSSYGIQILEVKLSEIKSVKEPPVNYYATRGIDFRELGKQIVSISPLLVSGDVRGTNGQRVSTHFSAIINQIASSEELQDVSSSTKKVIVSTCGERDETNQGKVEEVVERSISRGLVFLNNDRARAALQDTSLQVYVYNSDINQEGKHVAAFYMDSETGKSERGVLDSKKPSATVHITESNLFQTLDGRLDLIDALKKSQIRFTGSPIALGKLRFLLQLI